MEPLVITCGWVFRGFAAFRVCWNLGSHWFRVQLWVLTTTANKNQGPQPGITWEKGLKHFCCTLLLAVSAALVSFSHVLLQHSQKQRVIQKNKPLVVDLERWEWEGEGRGGRGMLGVQIKGDLISHRPFSPLSLLGIVVGGRAVLAWPSSTHRHCKGLSCATTLCGVSSTTKDRGMPFPPSLLHTYAIFYMWWSSLGDEQALLGLQTVSICYT